MLPSFELCSYSAADLSGKAACKRALQREMRLDPDPDIPLIGFIGRLDYQKGPDLVLDALPALSNLDCQVRRKPSCSHFYAKGLARTEDLLQGMHSVFCEMHYRYSCCWVRLVASV
jgi:starch synthase